MLRAAFVGAVLGGALFLGAALWVGLEPCAPDDAFAPAFEIANAPARVIAEAWPDGPVVPQSPPHECRGPRPHRYRPTPFVFWGLVIYGGAGGFAAGLWRMWAER